MQQLDKLLRSLAMSLKSRPSPLKKPLAPPDLQPKKEKFISRQKPTGKSNYITACKRNCLSSLAP